jgi:hypothetical protein
VRLISGSFATGSFFLGQQQVFRAFLPGSIFLTFLLQVGLFYHAGMRM